LRSSRRDGAAERAASPVRSFRSSAMRTRVRGIAPALVAAMLAGGVSGCFRNSYDMQCVAEGGAIQLAWTPDPAYQRYRVYRVTQGAEMAPVSEVDGVQWTDAAVAAGTQYHYLVRPIDEAGVDTGDAGGVGACSVLAEADDDGPPAVADLTCRPKDGKIDLAWTPVSGAVSYRVSRSGGGAPTSEVADVSDPVYADQGLVNGSIYEYAVVAVDASGHASPNSNAATCKPVARGEGDPPPVVAAPTCRGKNDKVDVSWTPVAGAAFYRVSRVQGANAPVLVGEVSGNVIADFGLPLDIAQQYSVASVSATGAVAAASEVCNVTPHGRADGNRAPVFTSEPLTSAIEQYYWWTQLAATDPDGDAVTFSLTIGPGGMQSSPLGLVSWTPSTLQIGPAVVEVRATDARGAYASQSFSVDVADLNEPPRITSQPVKLVEAGQPYQYDVDAFDPEDAALRFSFGAAVPSGMSIDPASGIVRWTPGSGSVAEVPIVVRAVDPAGGFDEQRFTLDVFTGAVELLAPTGDFEVEVGDTLDLEIRTNQPAAQRLAAPLPRGARNANGHIVFTPAEDQVGVYTIAVKAKLGQLFDIERITVRVTRGNRPPVLSDPGPQQVAEGAELVLPLVASDPDGDAITLSSGGPLPTNALLDVVGSRLVFRPSYDQAGTVDLVISASDGEATSEVTFPIQVTDREPPVDFSELVIDRVQSPTLQPRVRISGNVVGDPSGDPQPEAFVAVNGLSPATGRQGRGLAVTITGLNTEFAAGRSAASFGDGISVESLDVTSPTTAVARIAIAPDAALGSRVVTISGNGPAASSIVAFSVERGGAALSGQLVDSFTQAPLANARIVVNGTRFEATTDAEGRFTIEGVPQGAQQILIVRNDYETTTLDLAVAANQDVALPDAVGLRALARPFAPGGSLPRAATPASVLDRGVSSREGGVDQEQAEALVEDTLVAVGGDLVGVLDEGGAQLNPQVESGGLMTLTHVGVQTQARGIVEGGSFSLAEISLALTEAFTWSSAKPDVATLSSALNAFAKDAWASPGDPLNAMALVLLNQGSALSIAPPVVNGDTRFNRFQTFLLVQSILLPTLSTIEHSIDDYLRSEGVDPDVVAPPAVFASRAVPTPSYGERVAAVADRLLALYSPPDAHAQVGEGVVIPANTTSYGNPFARSTFTRIAKYNVANFLAQATIGNLMTAATVTAVQVAIAMALGATGGALGVVAATAFVGTVMSSFAGAVYEKIFYGLTLAAAASATTPLPPIPEKSFIDDVSQKFVLEFERTTSEAPGGSEPVGRPFYSYQLFDFKDPNTTDVSKGEIVESATLSEPPNSTKLRFAIPLGRLAPGVHFFRMAAIRYVSQSAYPLNAARIQFPYDTTLGAEDVSIQASNFLQVEFKLTDTEKFQIGDNARRRAFEQLQGIPRIEAEISQLDAEITSLTKQQHDLDTATKGIERTFYESNGGKQIVKSDRLVKLAVDHGVARGNPADFLDDAAPPRQKTLELLRTTNPDDIVRPDVAERMQRLSVSAADRAKYAEQLGVHERALQRIQDARRALITAPAGATRPITLAYDTIDPSDGSVVRIERQLPLNQEGAQQLAHLDDVERVRQTRAQGFHDEAHARVQTTTKQLAEAEVGASKAAFDDAISRRTVEAQTLQSEIAGKQGALQTAKSSAPLTRRDRIRNGFVNHKTTISRTLKVLNVVGAAATGYGMYEDFVKAFSVLYSDLSAAFMYVHQRRDLPDTAIEPHPNLYANSGVITTKQGFQGNARDGAIQNTYLDEEAEDAAFSTGFPPLFLAVDSQGRVYSDNANSNTRFSGRIFRFLPQQSDGVSMAREFVGTINYWSSLLQYGRPASPVAMTTGLVNYNGSTTETLFIADVDLLDTNDTVQAGRPVLKQMPIGLLEPGQPYAAADQRSHFVAQPWVQDARFRFDGPTDLVSNTSGETHRVWISDNENLFVAVQTGSGAPRVSQLINAPGMTFSGLAIDDGPEPNFYFSDFQTHVIYVLPLAEVIRSETEPSAIRGACPIGRFSEGPIYDIEIDQKQSRLIAATRGGVVNYPLPMIVQTLSTPRSLKLLRFGRVFPSSRLLALDGVTPCNLLFLTGEDHERGEVELVVERDGANGPFSKRFAVKTNPAGPTRVSLP
jgi:fibronectin type 3 domain-containing protein